MKKGQTSNLVLLMISLIITALVYALLLWFIDPGSGLEFETLEASVF